MNEAQALTLEAGKFYRTRDGRKAFVSGINPFPDGSHIRAIGVVVDEGVQGWDLNGAFTLELEHRLDLVAEWVEPKRIKGWVAIWAKGGDHSLVACCSHIYKTLEAAKADNFSNVACYAEIDVLEGHGLNGELA
ncbi:hypothetical protein N5C66_03725 [Rhizobium pusense]|uniref:Uncharacterized protein n=1 Tax=Agrobacterium genomosp. 2 str. CFBP 5494 TaxID=1183436 RepID=A0A9W5F0V7_9HYPH|nr:MULTISPECIES: hypothetical protein [Rhizobium/Agrobacterium group]MDH0908427.1 hypothetical protein [Agrobacterium pusense]MDH1094259.1 hypothetical protein [Agrobacterium pusense]MDH1110841.1 hypothetical protein [Agrobacterium pusense]MDH2192155.1 hypothetical protein [Agrobacterium pusense]CAD7043514.1 hypothetical protein RP007_01033 [Rhizobium sp. P007]